MKNIIHINTISELHKFLGLDEPKHPLISIFPYNNENAKATQENFKYSFNFYQISIKGNCPLLITKYGRSTYDFQECSMIFTAPNQVLEYHTDYTTTDGDCWTLVFHSDLIRKSVLSNLIDQYSFFSYQSNEALHLSQEERTTISGIKNKIIKEYENNLDPHSHNLIISNLQLLLNYCLRYYDRQFYTRTTFNKDIVTDFEQVLKEYYSTDQQITRGLPSVKYCADSLHVSPRYLSDLLKKESGKSTQDHIHDFIIEKAKNRLLNSNETASEIAFGLGFEYSQYFSKIFKKKTTMSPKQYRNTMS
ncbi:MAG: helix-turn-helix transcriptional regulator [Flavobacteriales bacterium]|jgi:AraC-like DNA-binding protein|nr:helix-turn-helix transcriptional regulator [Flavobacteriales bacterium]